MKRLNNLVKPLITSLILIGLSTPFYAGKTTYYSNWYNGRKMANGQRYNLNKLTAASNKYPLGAKIRVKNPKTGKSVVVIVTDRCKCYLDLSHAAFKQIGNTRKGYYNTKVAWIK